MQAAPRSGAPSTPKTLPLPVLTGEWPLLGHTRRSLTDLPGMLKEMKAVGGPLCWMKSAGAGWTLVYTDTEAFSLFKNKVTSSEQLGELGGLVLGAHSMLAADGATHRHLRKAASRPFTPRGLTMSGVSKTISEVVNHRVDAMMQREEINLAKETQRLALEVIFRIMGIPQEQLGDWAQRFTTLLRGVLGPHLNAPPFPYFFGKRARDWVDERLQVYIEAARNDPDSTGLVAEMVRGQDDEGKGLTDEELLDNLRLLVLAGHETTASVMAWMGSYLATDGPTWERLKAEALNNEGLPQSPSDMAAYPFAEALFRESLRLHPPLPVQAREVTTPIEIGGVTVPVGTNIGVPIWLFNRDPDIFPEPNRFNPDRWMGLERKLTPMEISAFGGGPHFCLGYHMAWVEAVQFATALTRALVQQGKALRLSRGLPRENYFPLIRPKAQDTVCRLVPDPPAQALA